jgi:Tol biopolymer transport system component
VFSSNRGVSFDLYLWDGGTELQLTYDERNEEVHPQFSPDGSRLAYVRRGTGSSHIMLLDIDRFTSLALVQWSGVDSKRPSWSPDGSQVAFFSNKTTSVAEFGLWVTDARPGSTPLNLATRVRLPTKGPAVWTPDGKHVIAVIADPDTRDCVALIPVDGSGPRCLDLGTDVNLDPQLVIVDGAWVLAWTSLRRSGRQLNIAELERE